jgi:predicted component of type VI protein secretion system
MPLIKVIRQGIVPSVRNVPTSTCAAVMPMTVDRVGKDAASDNEELTKVEDVNDAFAKFKPALHFKGSAGPEETEFQAELQFRNIKDFDPENLQRKQEIRGKDGEVTYLRNDLADLKRNIDLLYRLKDRWKLPAVRRAWAEENQRKEIIAALGRLRSELVKVVSKGGQ